MGSVYAENMGYFHKGSGGKGIAPIDVCLTPPPPPAGPIPVPYVNVLMASNLAKGSKKVKIEGNPTALENASHISTSTGNEPGTQGGGVVTAKTKGKGSFKLWSFTVKAEGKGVARHGDMMEQNTASPMPNCIDAAAFESFALMLGDLNGEPCAEAYDADQHRPTITMDQFRECMGGPCWECKRDNPTGQPGVWDTLVVSRSGEGDDRISIMKDRARDYRHDKSTDTQDAFTPDHQPPLVVAWMMGGCHLGEAAFKEEMKKEERVIPHCRKHAQSQGSRVSAFARKQYA